MDPTTVPPPSPQSPPYLPQNPHTPPDALIEPSAFQKCQPSTSQNTDNFKTLLFNLAGRLLPAHRSLIERRFDDILPHELLLPDHPPYADMILTALWELKAEGGSSEEAISHFIEKEYHELPWAHATILKHHLRDLCKKRKITMTHDRCYIRCLSIAKPKPPSPCPSPPSSTSSSSGSLCTSPSSSSSSMSWGDPYRTKKKKNRKGRKGRKSKTVQVSGRGRGRGRTPMTIQVGQRSRGRFRSEGRNKLEEPKQGTEDQNEVTIIEAEDYATQNGDVPVVDDLNVQSDVEVTKLEVDVCDAKVDEHVEQLEQKEEKLALEIATEHNQQEEKQQLDVVERQTVGDDRLMDDENLPEEQDSAMMQCVEPNKQLDSLTKEQEETKEQSAEMHEDDVTEEPDHPEEKCVEKTEESPQPCEQDQLEIVEAKPAAQEAHHTEVKQEEIMLAELQQEPIVEITEQQNGRYIQHTEISEKDSLQEKEQHTETSEKDSLQEKEKDTEISEKVSLQEKEQHKEISEKDSLQEKEQHTEISERNILQEKEQHTEISDNDSLQEEEQHTKISEKHSLQEEDQYTEISEKDSLQEKDQHTEISEKDSLQEKEKPMRNEENMTPSGSTTECSRWPSRPGLRSSSKKEVAAQSSKKQLELVTPVRRILRSHKAVSEAAVITEVPDHPKEQETHSRQTRSSKRKPEIAEVEQVPNTRRTRRMGL